jgi:hypothetical protein
MYQGCELMSKLFVRRVLVPAMLAVACLPPAHGA